MFCFNLRQKLYFTTNLSEQIHNPFMAEKISKEDFLELYNKATVVDYDGKFMVIEKNNKGFYWIYSYNDDENIFFDYSILDKEIEVSYLKDRFRFNDNNCKWFGLLAELKVR
jgi:hypothetical protein